ncbi:MAG: D-2-hydroxyacid dehydrogenase, partial [Cellvibrionales bacterium]|nr:D-2-hydroxyacid dehydrogenase [Cellvibrionales bacterium]
MHIVILDFETLKTGDLTPLKSMAKSLTLYDSTPNDELIERITDCDVIISNKVVLDANAIAHTNAKLICVAATGYNNVDISAAKSANIAVANVANYSTMSVVQHTFALMFNLLGNTHRYLANNKMKLWQNSEHFCLIDYPFEEVYNKTLVIIGCGNIGMAVKRVAEAFDMKVILAERKGQAPREGRMAFEQAIQAADIISIHCPLTEATRHLFSTEELNQLKKSTVILNLARGPIIDEDALVHALKLGKLSGAATDVLSEEPPTERNPLFAYEGENLLITPHIAWASQESVSRLIVAIKNNIIAFTQGESLNRIC